MPHQNRVNPFGELVAHPSKGSLMGNRGCLHNENGTIGRRRWTTKSWVTCALNFKDWRQPILAPGGYTQLFFLDEPTALAAGHRPCATCRRDRFDTFVNAWRKGNMPWSERVRVGDIDPVVHRERTLLICDRPSVDPATLPVGAQFTDESKSRVWLKWASGYHEWSFEGYSPPSAITEQTVRLLTPWSTVKALESGYLPEVHPSLLV